MADWAIPQQAKLKYTQLFNVHDRSRSGFLSGLQCRDILLQSGLARNVLAEIWNLSDIDGDGQLTREEFILAMYLTAQVRAGQPLPQELPPDLIPPSYRTNLPLSANPVAAVITPTVTPKETTVTPPVVTSSITNSNSFEDKRRENFEKGRAELERRRLKIIEEQSAILRDRLAASKKLVADAKAKIDAMRTERDTKMGLISSLEAQLHTLRDKKAYLNYEEINLSTLAPKQQNLIETREKLATSIKQNEIKQRELKEVNERLENSKRDLDVLSEKVTKRYEEYKVKIANAKLAKEKILEENKPQFTKKYRAIYEFEARNPDELTINPGDIIIGVDNACEPGWLSGQKDDRTGLFPEAYVELFADEEFKTVVDSKGPLSDLGWPEEDPFAPIVNTVNAPPAATITTISSDPASISFGTDDDSAIVIPQVAPTEAASSPSPQPETTTFHYKVIYPFDARNPDELTLNEGDVVIGLEGVCEPGWLMGELNGKKGLFPEAYVEKFIPEPAPIQDTPVKSSKSSKRAEVATVIANYRALGQEQLNLEKGQLVLIRRKMDSGWWEGEIQLKGKKKQFGWFPASYVKLL